MNAKTNNPFTPGAGIPPPVRAGHEDAIDHLGTLLDRIRSGGPGDGVVLVGPRGNGKTVLLAEILDQARKASVTTLKLLGEDMSGDKFSMERKLILGDSGRPRLPTLLPLCVLALIKLFRLGDIAGNSIHTALRWYAGKGPAMLVIDEAHAMPVEHGKHLFRAAQDLVMEKAPLLLVLAGTPGIVRHLGKVDASFWERHQQIRIGRLESLDDVRKALSTPAEQSGVPFDEEALELLVADSQRYPYFIQQLGFWAWKAAEGAGHSRITLADAKAGREKALGPRERFYRRRRDELAEQGVLAEAEAVSKAIVEQGNDPTISEETLHSALESAIQDRSKPLDETRGKLVDLGLVWQAPGDGWEPGIPSLCRYLVEFGKDKPETRPV